VAGPIDQHALRNDRVSAGAIQTISVGNRKLLAVADGFVRLRRTFLGTGSHPTAGYDALEAEYGDVRLPLGCFLLPGETNTLVDTGFGPEDHRDLGVMVGGRLLDRLNDQHVKPTDIDVVTLSHLHRDHIGWIADANGEPIFTNAKVYVARDDWDYFVEGGADPAPAAHTLHALGLLADRGQVELLDGETQVVPGLTRVPAPGHTPGHSIYIFHDGQDRVLLFGDAMYCPHQLTNSDWGAAWDVDPILAARTRERYIRDLEQHGGSALGCHFPELLAARMLVRPEAVDT
jgi:glyoxylase-like metal-dependent hydrolase (beta-lactamase superfamily II)